jgi:hypothetical protein
MKTEELNEIKAAIEASAEKGTNNALLKLGLNIDEPIEVQKDFAFARKQREASETVTKHAKLVLIGLFIVGGCSMLWAGFTDAIHK